MATYAPVITPTVMYQDPLAALDWLERAFGFGAAITQERADQFYGSRTYRARDPEGHIWCFSEFQRQVSDEEMQKSMPDFVFEDPEKQS